MGGAGPIAGPISAGGMQSFRVYQHDMAPEGAMSDDRGISHDQSVGYEGDLVSIGRRVK